MSAKIKIVGLITVLTALAVPMVYADNPAPAAEEKKTDKK